MITDHVPAVCLPLDHTCDLVAVAIPPLGRMEDRGDLDPAPPARRRSMAAAAPPEPEPGGPADQRLARTSGHWSPAWPVRTRHRSDLLREPRQQGPCGSQRHQHRQCRFVDEQRDMRPPEQGGGIPLAHQGGGLFPFTKAGRADAVEQFLRRARSAPAPSCPKPRPDPRRLGEPARWLTAARDRSTSLGLDRLAAAAGTYSATNGPRRCGR